MEEGVEVVEKTFEAEAEGWVHDKKSDTSFPVEIVGYGTFIILFICSICCYSLNRLCKEYYTEDSNPSPNRQRSHSPGTYRIQTQSSGLEESRLSGPMRDFTANMITNSNDQGRERPCSSSGGGATINATASPYSSSPHSSVLPPASSTDQSAHEHQVRRKTITNEDEPPPSYDQCVIIPTTIPDIHANPTAPPEEYEEKQPPYFFK